MLRPSRKTAILLVAGVVVCGLAAGLVLSGNSVGGSLGALGRAAIEKSIGLFAYTNKSTDAGKSFQRSRTTLAKATGSGTPEAGRVADASDGSAGVSPSDVAAGMAAITGSDAAAVAGTDVAAGSGGESQAGLSSDAGASASDGALPPSYVDAIVPSTPLDENDVTVDPNSDEYADGDPSDEDEFAFDDERKLRTEGPEYSPLGKKDPFYAMVTAKEQKAASSELLDPDRLRLVGVIWAKQGIGALVEDGRGRGYCLHEGDRVLFGRVISVTRDKCVIHQVIYGEFKTVELHLIAKREEE
jgi:hypothetical protein